MLQLAQCCDTRATNKSGAPRGLKPAAQVVVGLMKQGTSASLPVNRWIALGGTGKRRLTRGFWERYTGKRVCPCHPSVHSRRSTGRMGRDRRRSV